MGLSKSQAVSAAKLIKQAQRSGRVGKELPHAGTILVGEQASKTSKKHSKQGLSATFVTGANWDFSLDAGLLVDALTSSLLVLYRDGIMSGQRPDGSGAQPDLRARAANAKGRKGKVRGFRTGFLADNLRRSKITGSTTKASSRILPPTSRNVYLASEAKNGVSFFSVQGTAAAVIQEVTDEFVRGGLVNANRAADLSEKDSKSSK